MMPKELILPSGQRTTWLEYGLPSGEPLFFYNGWPGCGEQAVALHEIGSKLGWRIISPNRPGFCGADSQPGRGLLDWPPIVEAIADHLKIDRFTLLAVSGGGPYALATAWALKDRVRALGLCCSAVPTHTPEARQGLLRAYRFMLGLNDVAPWTLPWLLRCAALLARMPLPFPLLRILFRILLPRRDAALLSERRIFKLFQPSYLGAVLAGGQALYEDGLPYTKPWPFAVEDIQIPVHMWHGTFDANFHIAQARMLAARIPNVEFNERPEGHYSLPFNVAEEMLTELKLVSA